jgi:hypothetical protein
MTPIQTAIVTYVLSFLLLGGYALRLWVGLRKASRR